jgi:hypothetical protein
MPIVGATSKSGAKSPAGLWACGTSATDRTGIRVAALALLFVTCERSQLSAGKPERLRSSNVSGPQPSASGIESPRVVGPHWSPKPETLEVLGRVIGSTRQLVPQPAPPQRLAFFARNVAMLVGDSVWALPVSVDHFKNPCRPNRLPVVGPRELTPLADQTLLVVGSKTSVVLDSNCQTTVKLPRVSYIPGNRLLPEPRWPNAFSLFDPKSGSFSRFLWTEQPASSTEIWLPNSTLEDPNLRDSACALMRDGSLACVHDEQLVAGWPGTPTRTLGKIAHGSPVVRLLSAERADHVRVLRSDSLLEEYWLVPGPKKMRSFALPSVPLDATTGPGFLAILQVVQSSTGASEIRLVLLDADGSMRWSLPLETVRGDLSERDWLHAYFECRSIAAHPTHPWLVVSNCDHIDLYDTRNGRLLQRIESAAP